MLAVNSLIAEQIRHQMEDIPRPRGVVPPWGEGIADEHACASCLNVGEWRYRYIAERWIVGVLQHRGLGRFCRTCFEALEGC